MSDLFAAPDANAYDQGGGGSSGPSGRILYQIQNQNGQTAKIGDQDLLKQLHQAGHNPTGLSPDAKLVNFQDSHGQYQAPIEQVLQKLGWQVTGKDFQDSDRSGVNSALSFAINTSTLGANDQAKREFLTSYLRHHGVDNPQIDGMGDDWHAFDPQTGKWQALTKGSGIGMDDVAKYAAKAPSFLGSVLGAGAGTAGGPLGMAAGGAGGGFLGGRTSDALGGLVDQKAYSDAINKEGFQQVATDWAKQAGFDALGGGGAGILGKFAPTIAKAGLASRALTGTGALAEGTGKAVAAGADKLSGGLARELGMAAIDPLGVVTAGDAAGIPAQAIKGGAALYDKFAPNIGRGIQRAASHPMAEELAPELAGKARGIGQAMRMRTPTFSEGMNAEEALQHTPFGGVGKFADHAENLGKAVVAPVRAAYTTGMRGIQGLGKATELGGGAMQAIGNATGRHELNAAAHYGSEELYQRLLKRQRDLQRQGVDLKLVPDTQLADQEFQPPY